MFLLWFSFKEKKIFTFSTNLVIGGITGVVAFRLNIYLMNIPCDCSSFTKYVQRRLAGNDDIDFLLKKTKIKMNIFLMKIFPTKMEYYLDQVLFDIDE